MSQPVIFEERPPYVRFERRSLEDRTATLKQGHYVGKDVDFALITPAGSKDCVERVASEWLEKIERDAFEGRMPRQWLDHFKSLHKAWLAGQDEPLNGTSVKQWPILSPTQVKMLLSMKVMTIEDMAAANEETLARLGMGGRELKRRAIDWIGQSKELGKFNNEMHALRVKGEELLTRNAQLEADTIRYLQIIRQYEQRLGIPREQSAIAAPAEVDTTQSDATEEVFRKL